MDLVFFFSGDLLGSLGTVVGLEEGLERGFSFAEAGMTAAVLDRVPVLGLVAAALRTDFFPAILDLERRG